MIDAKEAKGGLESFKREDDVSSDRDFSSEELTGSPLNYFHHEAVEGWHGEEDEEEAPDDPQQSPGGRLQRRPDNRCPRAHGAP